jgi:CRP-like cAMP-binding protein
VIFLNSIPELRNIGLARSKIQLFCQSLIPITLIKGAILFREGEQNEYLYFLKKGELVIRKKVAFPKLGVDAEDVAKLLSDPQ